MKYVGDISKEDARVLGRLGYGGRVLEFGMGGSTQVLAQVARHLTSIETDPEWLKRTRNNLETLKIDPSKYDLKPYFKWPDAVKGLEFDFIFVDGVDEMRFPFAIMAFPLLKIGGVLAFHDTRRGPDMQNFLNTVLQFKDEAGVIFLNRMDSNISGFHRKARQPYADWNKTENKEPWQTGAVPPPENWPELMEDIL